MNYARRRVLQSTCPTSTEQQQLYRALASVMTAVISSAPSHMGAEAVGRRAVVFDSRPGKRLLADGGEGTGPGKDHHSPPLMVVPVQSVAFLTVQRAGRLSGAHGDGPERPDCRRAYGPTARGAPSSPGSGPESEAKEMPAHKEEGGILGSYHIRERHHHGPMQNLRSDTDLRDGVAAVPGAGVVLPQVRQRLCEHRRPVTPAYHLTSAPILAYPEFHRRFTVDVDVRGDGLGAVLSQREGKTERVVAYASRTLTKAARRYCATQKEMLGLVWALREFRPYLYGQRFLVRTDHSCLRWLRNFKEPEGQFYTVWTAGRRQCMSSSSCQTWIWDVIESIRERLVAAQQADSDIRLLRQWLVGANWPVECPMRDMHVLWRSGVVGRM
ncbi:Retrovirus-related Pol polyprotein from transposon [Trichinella patagoniensis]|uniref:Retrovirus-related Pol polyprotein from transposon n=1 Tax=Trichinella patagoniensis TaxID=990121 RepID=A0A0V1A3K9_9BILA|nr:Retrovirus-related Pol polyprotein from transposon [Trichinella patagoniensis]